MNLRITLIASSILLTACAAKVTQQSLTLPLYPHAEWSEVQEGVRAFLWDGEETQINGWEIMGTYDDGVQKDFFYSDSEHADQDFWHFYLGESTLMDLGYDTIFTEEQQFDRQFVGLQDEENHVLLFSNMVEFSVPFPEDPECPCKYTFTIFTDDERVELQ